MPTWSWAQSIYHSGLQTSSVLMVPLWVFKQVSVDLFWPKQYAVVDYSHLSKKMISFYHLIHYMGNCSFYQSTGLKSLKTPHD